MVMSSSTKSQKQNEGTICHVEPITTLTTLSHITNVIKYYQSSTSNPISKTNHMFNATSDTPYLNVIQSPHTLSPYSQSHHIHKKNKLY